MNKLMHALLAMGLSAPAWAANEPSNTTTTTLELYGAVAAVFVAGFAWILWHQKKEKERDKRRESRLSKAV